MTPPSSLSLVYHLHHSLWLASVSSSHSNKIIVNKSLLLHLLITMRTIAVMFYSQYLWTTDIVKQTSTVCINNGFIATVYKLVIVFHNLQITWDFLKYVVKCCQGCMFNNCSKTTHCTQKYFLNSFYMYCTLFFENSSSKASGLLFIFVCVSMGHAHFQLTRYAFPMSLKG